MQQLRRDLIKKGWSIIKCKNLTDIELISKNFINELKKNITLASILKKQNIKDIAGLRKFANKLEDGTFYTVINTRASRKLANRLNFERGGI